MRRRNLALTFTALVLTITISGCATQAPVATNSSKKKVYISEDTPTTGSHIARRYAADDATAASASNVSAANAADVQRPQLGRGGN
jgi:hypothetical protein